MHTPITRRAGFLAASALGLALFGALTTSSADAAQIAMCNGLVVTDFVDPITNTFIGGGAAEVIQGTEDSDDILSGGGADTICALDGNDEVDAGTGADWVSGGEGDDVLDGFTENDTLFGNADEDTLNGGDHNDTLRGGGQNDVLDGGDDDDDLFCGGGNNDDAEGGNHVAGDAFIGAQQNGGCESFSGVNP